MPKSDKQIVAFEVLALIAVFGMGELITIMLNTYILEEPNPVFYGGAVTLLAYSTFWIAFSKWKFDTFWAVKTDFEQIPITEYKDD